MKGGRMHDEYRLELGKGGVLGMAIYEREGKAKRKRGKEGRPEE